MKLVALLLVAACHSGAQPSVPSPAASTATTRTPARPSGSGPTSTARRPPEIDWNHRFGDGPTIPTTGVTFADPKHSSRHVEVTARLVGVDPDTALCGIIHWGSLVEYEVVSIESGTLTGQHFLALVGCIDLPRTSYDTNAGSLQRFQIGDVHNLLISTDRADSRGMSDATTLPPHFYVISADPK